VYNFFFYFLSLLARQDSVTGTKFKEGPGVNWFPNGDALGENNVCTNCCVIPVTVVFDL
jgi:hypothetical protein